MFAFLCAFCAGKDNFADIFVTRNSTAWCSFQTGLWTHKFHALPDRMLKEDLYEIYGPWFLLSPLASGYWCGRPGGRHLHQTGKMWPVHHLFYFNPVFCLMFWFARPFLLRCLSDICDPSILVSDAPVLEYHLKFARAGKELRHKKTVFQTACIVVRLLCC